MNKSNSYQKNQAVWFISKILSGNISHVCASALVLILCFFFWNITWAQSVPSQERKIITVDIITELGTIKAELYRGQAPRTVDNFLKYVDQDHYDGGSFFRTVRDDNQPDSPVKIDVIQAGPHPWFQFFDLEPINLERTTLTGLKHLKGTISMARDSPDSATSSFFICVEDEPELDFGGKRNPDGQGFAAFGKVIEGMDVVSRIHKSEINGQAIRIPVRILDITR